jgi:chemotaxis receptor (MCP) glutamine deamidase CheD
MAVHYPKENYTMPKSTTKLSLNQKIRAASKDLKVLTKAVEKSGKTTERLTAKAAKVGEKLAKLQAKVAPTA